VPERVIDIWTKVRLHCPLATAQLCRDWVNNAQAAVGSRRPWSHLRLFGQITTNDAKAGLVTATRFSTVVQGPGAPTPLFAASDVGRQIRIGMISPVYTLTAVDLTNDTAILDEPWGPASVVGAQTTILDAYVTMPREFNRFLGIIDPVNNWQLHWYVTEAQLNRWDPQRTSTTTPWALVSRGYSQLEATRGQPQYELWPYTTAANYYPYVALRQPKVLGDLDELEGPFQYRPDILEMLCLVEAARWPGPSFDQKNVYFNLANSQMLKKEAEEELWILEQRDDEIFPTLKESVSWQDLPWSPVDSRFLQNHDVYSGSSYF
jgi:hypothetical protein